MAKASIKRAQPVTPPIEAVVLELSHPEAIALQLLLSTLTGEEIAKLRLKLTESWRKNSVDDIEAAQKKTFSSIYSALVAHGLLTKTPRTGWDTTEAYRAKGVFSNQQVYGKPYNR